MAFQLTKDQRAEMERLRKKHRLLTAEQVVAFAADSETALHSRFTWDDTEAARQFRLDQARSVIRVAVYVPESSTKPMRVMVSLREDQKRAGGGYRSVPNVLTRKVLREQLVAEALREFERLKMKYHALKELAAVFDAVDHAKEVAASNGKAKPSRRRVKV
jgi:hypothetical protein